MSVNLLSLVDNVEGLMANWYRRPFVCRPHWTPGQAFHHVFVSDRLDHQDICEVELWSTAPVCLLFLQRPLGSFQAELTGSGVTARCAERAVAVEFRTRMTAALQ